MKYSEIIDVAKHFNDTYDITSDKGTAWKTFISNDKFENNMFQIINCFLSPVYNNRKSIWIQGTYGTGKSHSLAVVKHLLYDDYSEIKDYLSSINKVQLRTSISSFRKNKRVFPVILKGIYAITDVADLTYTIQQQVAIALKEHNIEINTKTDFQAVIQILKAGKLDSFFENLLDNNIELRSYAPSKEQLIGVLENNETNVIRIIADELKKAGLGGFRTHNIVDWLSEVKQELVKQGIADYLMLFWDEFTSLLEIPARKSILNVMQHIAELSTREVEGGSDTLGVYLFLITHKKLEQTETYRELQEDERNMANARFLSLDYDMQPTTTYHILSGALDRKKSTILDNLRNDNISNIASVSNVINKIVNLDSPNVTEVKAKIVSLYPIHPYTAYLATFLSRVVGEAERSIFKFLTDEESGFKKFIKNDIEEINFLTADYVWDFFYKTFESGLAGHFDAVTNKYKLSGELIAAQGNEHVAVFKTILLLNILYRVTTTDADTSERSMVNPSTDNIIDAFSGILDVTRVNEILDYIDSAQILHRNPDGIFEIASSSLPPKKILEEKKKLYPNKEDVSAIIEEYSISCLGKLRKSISSSVTREVDTQVFWGGEKEHLLKARINGKFKMPYTLHVAIMVYRGATRELDEILGRNEANIEASKKVILNLSKEEEHQNIVFIVVNTELGNKRFESYMDCLAQESVARSLKMEDERKEGQVNAEKWITKWMDEIIANGMVDLIFRGDSIYVPFSQCNQFLNDNYSCTIFKYGLDCLDVSDTFWNKQNSKKAVELALYSSTKATLEQDAKGNDAAVKYLLSYDNILLFDESLSLVSDDEKIPIVKVCKEIERVMESNKNETIINLADKLKFLIYPPYGFYQNRLFMGSFALAIRPYIDRLYISGNGQKVDKTVMKEIVVAIFTYWEDAKKFNDKFCVRMSTEEERELTDRLKSIFGISNIEGLLSTKWAIREKFKNQSKSPLWALKYIGSPSEKYCIFIDKLFKFSKSTDENILQDFILELLNGIRIFDVDIANAISSVESEQCLDSYFLRALQEIGEQEQSLEELKHFLSQKMNEDIVFWEEKHVHEQILLWKISKQKEREKPQNTPSHENSPQVNPSENPNNQNTTEDISIDIRIRAENKIHECKYNSEKLLKLLQMLMEKYSSIAKDIDEFL